MEAREMGEGTAHTLQRRRSAIAVLAVAGIVGPILFTVVAVFHSLLRSDHSPSGAPDQRTGDGAKRLDAGRELRHLWTSVPRIPNRASSRSASEAMGRGRARASGS